MVRTPLGGLSPTNQRRCEEVSNQKAELRGDADAADVDANAAVQLRQLS